MRVHLVGNTCNYAYSFAKFFNDTGGPSAVVHVESTAVSRDRPTWEREDDRVTDEPWVRYLPKTLFPGGFLSRATRRAGFEGADVLHAFGAVAAMWAERSGKPYVYQSYGDINTSPFLSTPIKLSSPARVMLTRSAIHKASTVVISQLNDFESAYRLGLRDRLIALPIPYDCDLVMRLGNSTSNTLTSVSAGRPVFYVPSRVVKFKRHDKIVRVLESVMRERRLDAVLAFAEWGEDLPWLKQHIASSSISKKVRWVPCLPKVQLLQAMREPTVTVLDEFPDGPTEWSFGGVSRDAMAAGVPLLTKISIANIDRLHGSKPPILWTDGSEDALKHRLNELLDMSAADKSSLVTRAQSWMRSEHHFANLLPRYVALYDQCRN